MDSHKQKVEQARAFINQAKELLEFVRDEKQKMKDDNFATSEQIQQAEQSIEFFNGAVDCLDAALCSIYDA